MAPVKAELAGWRAVHRTERLAIITVRRENSHGVARGKGEQNSIAKVAAGKISETALPFRALPTTTTERRYELKAVARVS